MCVTKSQGGNIPGNDFELYYGGKNTIMSDMFSTMFLTSPNKAVVDEQTVLEFEIIRQPLIAVEKTKKNSDCIAEGNLEDAVTVSVCGGY